MGLQICHGMMLDDGPYLPSDVLDTRLVFYTNISFFVWIGIRYYIFRFCLWCSSQTFNTFSFQLPLENALIKRRNRVFCLHFPAYCLKSNEALRVAIKLNNSRVLIPLVWSTRSVLAVIFILHDNCTFYSSFSRFGV